MYRHMKSKDISIDMYRHIKSKDISSKDILISFENEFNHPKEATYMQ